MTDTDEARRKRSEAARKGAATEGPEARRAAVLKAAVTMGPERRKEAALKGAASRDPNCLVAERCWDQARWAIEAYAWRFDGLEHAPRTGGAAWCSRSTPMRAPPRPCGPRSPA